MLIKRFEQNRELTLHEIQNIGMELLKAFRVICANQGYRYSLGGGSLLGAVRHQGFIPWDDDIDVMMPRPDYDKFINYCRQHKTSFQLISYETTKGYYGLFAKISDPSTIIVEKVIKTDYEAGVSIDIFPIDGLGSSEADAVQIFRKTTVNRELLNAATWKSYSRSKTHSILLEPVRLTLYLISRLVDPEELLIKVDRENKSHSFEDSCYAGCVCGSYREKEIMKTSVFKTYTELAFENTQFSVIADYDVYLKKHYGNYMELPPVERRVTHHTYSAYRK